MSESKDGLSVRFIRQYDPDDDRFKNTISGAFDVALSLAMTDDRDIPFAEKMADARAFIKSRIH